ncbi:DUF5597 domain-containing protein [Nanchangia anserum]|uniref:DUF5597 domain-containing protein n=1 Tax=Nanchangia anserum TaxID=2692125 RepID=A0A8I0KRU2_9ACTO|nr:DUF5597 domain-containing protein [Nanchangia anserum]MBD3689737.1 DUF5597 domain-containing protein [Nanchangia anserum]QOX81909.1 DUF5597 domain-containing protein [Nanchangia anserum]
MKPIPAVRNHGGIPTLYVDDEPFFIRGGELHNSSASQLDYMNSHVWPNLRDLNMNAVLVPVYWELVEPEPGHFDFTLVDGLVAQARENSLRLVLLWFGLWKNSESMYAPAWVKRDTDTYRRGEDVSGRPATIVTPLCEAAVTRDAQAFAALMAHLRDTDAERTVIMVQVENEIGILGSDRDYSAEAEAAFASAVPECLSREDGTTGTWSEVYGDNAGEAFMAYHYASAVEKITAAGRAEYPLPCYANAWLKQYPWYPGSYPSGGPVCDVHPVWRAAAPSLVTLAPDIYVPYVPDVIDAYGYDGNPLFIPEVRKDAVTASYCLYAFGKAHALGYSPFGIEELVLPEEQIDKPPMAVMRALNIDPTAFDTAGSARYLAATYEMCERLMPIYLKYRASDRMWAFCRHNETDFGTFISASEFDISVAYAPRESRKPVGAGIVIECEDGSFIICGMMSTISFRAKPGRNVTVDFLTVEEGTFIDGQWQRGRVLNGDERMSLRLGDTVTCLKATPYAF